MRSWLLLIVAAGCYAPHPQTGSPCSDTRPCPAPLVCATIAQTCQQTDDSGSAVADAPPSVIDSPRLIDGCVPSREYCGDGIDQDCDGFDPPCPVNDTASTPTDIDLGGTFTNEIKYAHDDSAIGGCGGTGAGGRDVFYSVKVTTDEVYYIDTFGSDFDTVIRVFHNTTCAALIGTGFCRNDACGTLQSQYIGTMSGDNCVVVDQASSAETNGHLVLHVERGGRIGTRLNGTSTVTGTTCAAATDFTGTCGGAGPNVDYYFSTCPGTTTLTATTCNVATTYDSSLFVFNASGATEVACNDDDAACVASGGDSTLTNVQLAGAHLFWLVVDTQTTAGCGPYSLAVTLN